ncbi:protein of unknown function [Nitrospina watsonii]|uniref:Uncharacterized protein n=1 Tax=Nitrospina watsonii TaxID=1323948 RepID=A0ABM9HAG2_9BACT|nr:protein of unknown function [Nitrospina watsonii]
MKNRVLLATDLKAKKELVGDGPGFLAWTDVLIGDKWRFMKQKIQYAGINGRVWKPVFAFSGVTLH